MVKVIINADDFGISDKFNKAIFDLIENHCLRSVSVIIRKNINREHVKRLLKLRKTKNISIGLHFEYSGIDDYKKIYKSLSAQYELFKKIFGIKPIHLNKHNWENSEDELKAETDFAIANNLKLRLYTRGNYFNLYEENYKNKIKLTNKLYNSCSRKYGIGLLKREIPKFKKLKENIILEVVCHPGFYDPKFDVKINQTQLNEEREQDYKKIIDLCNYLKERKVPVISFSDI